jgi:acyl-CoA thioesterase I
MLRRHFSLLLLSVCVAGPTLAQSKSKAAPTILVLGDSLSAEYGLQRGQGWVALMQARLAQEKITAQVINASISGDTTSGGRSRLPALLAQHKPQVLIIELGGNDALRRLPALLAQHQPSLVIVELGANDALRGLPVAMTQDNLQAMVQAAKAAGAKVLLVGMQVPPNYGQSYGQQFAGTFGTVAKAQQVALVPFLLKGVADAPDALKLFQADRIHPVAAAHPTILNTLWPAVRKLL